MIINWKEAIEQDVSGGCFYNGGWVKTVTAVDKSKSNGYAFEGEFVSGATKGLTECADGYYLVCSVEGSRKNQRKEVALFRISGDTVDRLTDWACGNDWSLKLRDKVADLLAAPTEEVNPLEGFTAEQLLEELARRGVEIS